MTQEHDIRLAYISTLLDGGYTRLADGTTNPTEGYIVGGVTEPTTMGLPGVSLFTFTVAEMYDEFKELWLKYKMQLNETTSLKFSYTTNLFKSGLGVGTWIHEGQIYFDIVQHIYSLDVATKLAKERSEIAVYDCANQKDLLL